MKKNREETTNETNSDSENSRSGPSWRIEIIKPNFIRLEPGGRGMTTGEKDGPVHIWHISWRILPCPLSSTQIALREVSPFSFWLRRSYHFNQKGFFSPLPAPPLPLPLPIHPKSDSPLSFTWADRNLIKTLKVSLISLLLVKRILVDKQLF